MNTFGYIAKAIGPQDVLATLLNNLKVQERQNRVCTTVAIAIVAETCSPFTVLPGLMNEYRVPELNVQNGVLKSLSFLFEYIGEMGKDYIYAITPLLEDAMMDRDLVHRQTACTVSSSPRCFFDWEWVLVGGIPSDHRANPTQLSPPPSPPLQAI